MFAKSRRWPALLVAISVFLAGSASHLFGYALTGPVWPTGSTINEHLAFTGPSSGRLQDGFATFNASATDALILWNQQINLVHLNAIVTGIPGTKGDGQNTAFFSSNVYGMSFSPGTLAITVFFYDGSTMKEADNVFNATILWDSYRGPLQYNSKKKQYVIDFHRVALHEFGHTLGLDHPDDYGQIVTAIMNSHVSDLDHLADDDIAGAKWLYGLRITSEPDPFESPVGENFSYQITANNSPASFSATGLPAGLTLNSTSGLISGKPIVSGTFNVNVSATGPTGTATGIVTVTISKPVLTTLIAVPAWVGNPFSFQLRATSQPTGYDASGLPAGLEINKQTGLIHGQLIVVGVFAIQVTAHTPYGDASGTLYLHVFPPDINSASFLDDVFTGLPLNYQITASTTQATYAAEGLPPGLSVDSTTGMITGVPTLSRRYNVVLIAHTVWGDAKGTLSLNLTPPEDKPDVHVPFFARDILADPARSRLYLNDGPGNMAVFDINSLTMIGTLQMGDWRGVCFSADNTELWASYYNPRSIVAYNLITFSPVRTVLPSVTVSQIREGVGGQMYICDSNVVSRLDLNSGAIVTVPWPAEADALLLIEMSADHKTLFVGDWQGAPSTLVKYDISSGTPVLTQSITQPDWGKNIVVDPASRRLCFLTYDYPIGQTGRHYQVPLRSATDLNVTFGVLNPSTSAAGLVAFSADGQLLFELPPDTARVDVYDTGAMHLVRRINLAQASSVAQMVVDRDNKYLFLNDASYLGLVGYLVNPPSPPPIAFPAHTLANVSTRASVGTSDNVEIGGFILRGTQPKKVIMRALAPILTTYGVANAMADPILDLYDSTGRIIATNDNWNANRQEVIATGKAPLDEHEAVIVTTLPPGSYTALLRGTGHSTGVALLELYDLAPQNSKLSNISTRGQVGIGDNVMIGGFVVGGDQSTNVIVRALGPTLTDFGVNDALVDPTLELHNGNGDVLAQNDNWKSTQQAAIQNSGYAPPKDTEAAILATLQPGNYTAIVRGNNNTTGVALIEVYNLDAN